MIDLLQSAGNDELPAYRRRGALRTSLPQAVLTDFSYGLIHPRRRNAWANLSIRADKKLSETVPTFMEGTDVAGTLTLDAEHAQDIKRISVTVRFSSRGTFKQHVDDLAFDV